jgi:hypothetical protein
MTNKDWYYTDLEFENEYGGNIHLTELGKLIPAVVKSFAKFYAVEYDDDGTIVDS